MNNTTNTNTNKNEPSKLNGNLNKAAGAVKQTAGKVLGDEEMIAKGKEDSIKGSAEVTTAKLKEKAKVGLHMAGDALERVGEKLADAGFEKAGAAVRAAGDKIEHSAD